MNIVCPNCGTENPSQARFCMNCGAALAGQAPADQATHTRLAAATPGALADKIRAARFVGERRPVTSLFVDVVNSSGLAAQMDPEEWATVLNSVFDRFATVIYRYEGTIARLMGDAVLAFFGAPVAHEDDPVRATRAGLDLLAVARDCAAELESSHGLDFAVRVGISTGLVVLGNVGSQMRYDYLDIGETAIGDSVNLAAHLQAAARPMTLLISEATYRFVQPIFDCADLGTIALKGAERSTRAYQVIGPKAEPGRTRGLGGLESPMVGREQELAELLRSGKAVQGGRGQVALIIGEPGLGKSRMLAEWWAVTTPALQWAVGRCISYGQNFAYHLLLDLLRSLLGVAPAAEEAEQHAALKHLTGDLFPEGENEVYPFLGHLLALQLEGTALEQVRMLDPQALQDRYLNALRRLLRAMAERQPLALALEDIHWADPSSTTLLVRLLALVKEAPILFCVVTRPYPDVAGWQLVETVRDHLLEHMVEINLSPLPEEASRELVSNLLEIEALPDRVRDLILERAEGNPFFVEEIIRELIEREAIVKEGERWAVGQELSSIDIPDNLQGLLLARIDRLPDDVKRTLRVAAVIGREFSVKVLQEVLKG
jgi:class 3 adenylate cyclase